MPQGEGDWVLFRRQCYRIVMWDREGKHTGRDFDVIVSIMIMANVLNMSLYFWAAPNELQPVTTPMLTPTLTPTLSPMLHLTPDCTAQIGSSAALSNTETDLNHSLEYLNFVFTWLFVGEMTLKHLALGAIQHPKPPLPNAPHYPTPEPQP